MDLFEEKLLFNTEVDEDNKKIKLEALDEKISEPFIKNEAIDLTKNDKSTTDTKSNVFNDTLVHNATSKEFSVQLNKKLFADASDKTINIGPSVKKHEKNFGRYTPQVIDHLQAENCIHDICYPPNWDLEKARKELSTPLPSKEPAKSYKFELDPFQKRAINCVERRHNILIAAHTSAGKTTVAEYAIAKSIKEGTRVIYTSPIKALSNQKYRDLYEEFQDVGLMTGDVTINPSASCLVMTTEILRNMLYRGSEVIREVSWVIFDEIHYMRNESRGVIYEECLILLPHVTKFVFLSATIPNASEFACWVAKINNTPCNVVYTEKRPVPLQHYVSPKGASGLTLILDEKKIFKEENFVNAINSIKEEDFRAMIKKKKRKTMDEEENLFKVMKLLMAKKSYPAIIFAFSRRDCETNALLMTKLDFNNQKEKETIEHIFENAADSLSTDDRKLPQVRSILPLLKRGIGIHHSGLLPILKEVIEILFQEGLIKALFATETFAMGINMPAKTVIFTKLRKFDGFDTRYLTSGEYIQMSGRAGRRGIDEKGLIILMVAEKVEPSIIKKILEGKADSLDSSFTLGYNMLLNLLRVEGSDPEYMISHSFYQFQTTLKTPVIKNELIKLKRNLAQIHLDNEKEIEKIYLRQLEFESSNKEFKALRNRPEHLLPFLNPGRLVKIVDKDNNWGYGAIVNYEKKHKSDIPDDGLFSKNKEDTSRFQYLTNVFLSYRIDPMTKTPVPLTGTESKTEIVHGVIPCTLNSIEEISSIRIQMEATGSRKLKDKEKVIEFIEKVFETYTEQSLPMLDPIENMNIQSKNFKKRFNKMQQTKKDLNKAKEDFSTQFESQTNNYGTLEEKIKQYRQQVEIKQKIKENEKKLAELEENAVIKRRLKCMRKVLLKLGYATEENVVTLKGRVACDISTSDELLATELLLSGVFNGLTCEKIVALSSCLVSCDKVDGPIRLKPELAIPYENLEKSAQQIANVLYECLPDFDPQEYVDSFKPNLMEVTYAWCKGAKFSEICKMTTIFEGGIIRVIRRLGELLGEFVYACKIIGNVDLSAKFEQGIKLIKRDIIFAASLYL